MGFESWQQENKRTAPIPAPAQTGGFEAWQAENKQAAAPLEPTQKLKAVKESLTATQDQIRAESQSLDRFKIQRLLGLNPNLTPEQVQSAAIGLTSSEMDTLIDYSKRISTGKNLAQLQAKIGMHEIYRGKGTDKDKELAAAEFISKEVSGAAQDLQRQAQDITDARMMQKDQESLKGEFLAKTARRWDRGIVNTIGGGLHFMDELTRIMGIEDTGGEGDYSSRARAQHELLQSPTFQPVVENAFDKYFGAGVETAPFMISTMVPHVLTGGTAAMLGSFMVAFGIEGNNTYQSAVDRGVSEREARMRGFTVGTLNGIIEMAGGSGGKFLKQSVARKVASKLAKVKVVTKGFAKNALKEGFLEELPQEFISMTAGGGAPKNEDGTVNWSAAFDQGWDAALTGTILGGAFGSPGAISTAAKTKVQAKAPMKGEPLANVPVTAKFIDTVVGKVPVQPGVSPALENIQNPTPIQTSVADRNVKLRVAHEIAKKMELKGGEFEVYKQTYGEHTSMADMTDGQLDAVIEQLQIDGTTAGLVAGDIEVKMTPAEELIKQVKSIRRYKPVAEAQERKRGAVRKVYETVKGAWSGYWGSQDRIRNIARVLDEYEDAGPFSRHVWDSIKEARTRKERVWNDTMGGIRTSFDEQGINVAGMMDNRREDVIVDKDGTGFPITDTERIGLYLHSKNKKNLKKVSAWFENNNIDAKKAFDAVTKSVETNEQEKFVADQVAAYFKSRGPTFLATAKAMGIEDVKTEKNYFPQIATKPDEVTGEDVVDIFEEHFAKQLQVPGRQHTKKRTGGEEKIEWDAISTLVKVSNRMESLIEVGPIAQQVHKMLAKKELRRTINDATNGKGAETLNKWVRDSARGTAEMSHGSAERIIRSLRTNSVKFTLGLKIFTSMPKAILSAINGMSSRVGMAPAVMKVFAEYAIPGGLERVRNEVYSKSDIMLNRDPERDIRTMWDKKVIRKFFKGKNLSPLALRYWTWADKATANAVWLGAYRLATRDGASEMDARRYANNRTQESQPMASVEDLPDVFRGTELEKALTTFMGMLNTTQQYLKHDIIGEYKAGKISGQQALYRFSMGEIMPALVLGVIVRGRPPETPREIIEDIASYLMSPAIFFGRFIFNMAANKYDPVKAGLSAIPLRGFEASVDTFRAAMEGEGTDVVEGVARTIGAFTGAIPEQAIITARGAYDLAYGETDDYKRLMRTEGNIRYNAPTSDTARSGARRKRSGQRRTGRSRKGRSRS